jgi:hypothetical protein
MHTTNYRIILLVNTLEMNRRHTRIEFTQIRPIEINGKQNIITGILFVIVSLTP